MRHSWEKEDLLRQLFESQWIEKQHKDFTDFIITQEYNQSNQEIVAQGLIQFLSFIEGDLDRYRDKKDFLDIIALAPELFFKLNSPIEMHKWLDKLNSENYIFLLTDYRKLFTRIKLLDTPSQRLIFLQKFDNQQIKRCIANIDQLVEILGLHEPDNNKHDPAFIQERDNLLDQWCNWIPHELIADTRSISVILSSVKDLTVRKKLIDLFIMTLCTTLDKLSSLIKELPKAQHEEIIHIIDLTKLTMSFVELLNFVKDKDILPAEKIRLLRKMNWLAVPHLTGLNVATLFNALKDTVYQKYMSEAFIDDCIKKIADISSSKIQGYGQVWLEGQRKQSQASNCVEQELVNFLKSGEITSEKRKVLLNHLDLSFFETDYYYERFNPLEKTRGINYSFLSTHVEKILDQSEMEGSLDERADWHLQRQMNRFISDFDVSKISPPKTNLRKINQLSKLADQVVNQSAFLNKAIRSLKKGIFSWEAKGKRKALIKAEVATKFLECVIRKMMYDMAADTDDRGLHIYSLKLIQGKLNGILNDKQSHAQFINPISRAVGITKDIALILSGVGLISVFVGHCLSAVTHDETWKDGLFSITSKTTKLLSSTHSKLLFFQKTLVKQLQPPAAQPPFYRKLKKKIILFPPQAKKR